METKLPADGEFSCPSARTVVSAYREYELSAVNPRTKAGSSPPPTHSESRDPAVRLPAVGDVTR